MTVSKAILRGVLMALWLGMITAVLPAADELMPMPSPKDQSKALEALKEELTDEYAAGENDKAELLRTLLEYGASDMNASARRYMAFKEAFGVAFAMRDFDKATLSIKMTTKRFAVNGVPLWTAVLGKLKDAARTPDERAAVARGYLAFVDVALNELDADAAEDAAKVAETLAVTDEQADLVEQAREKQADVTAARDYMGDLIKARKRLESSPNDAKANETMGAYLAFRRKRLQEGMKMLAKSRDEQLREVAKLELNPPGDFEDFVHMGDLWFDVAAKQKDGNLKTDMGLRAAYWYELALPYMGRGIPFNLLRNKIHQLKQGE